MPEPVAVPVAVPVVVTRAALRNAQQFAALPPQPLQGAWQPGQVGTNPLTRHMNGSRGPSNSAPTSPAGHIPPRQQATHQPPAVPEQDDDTAAPGPTKLKRAWDGTSGFRAGTSVALERLGQLIALIKPTAEGFNTAKDPKVVCVFLLVALGLLLGYGLLNRLIDFQYTMGAAEERASLVKGLSQRCTDDDHSLSCQRLNELLNLNHSTFQDAPKEADPLPPDETPVCWKAGPAIRKAGAADATELTVAQAATAYGEVVRPLPPAWLLRTDLQAFVREEVDINRDGAITRFEVYAGLAKLIRREQWDDTYADSLWVLPVA